MLHRGIIRVATKAGPIWYRLGVKTAGHVKYLADLPLPNTARINIGHGKQTSKAAESQYLLTFSSQVVVACRRSSWKEA
eukprot:4957343-Amphidinium_carterae.1